MTNLLQVGQAVPHFKAQDTQGDSLSAEKLKGQPYVLYFYPKDNTPGCTAQACSFRDHQDIFDQQEVRVIGVSPDSSSSHQKFSQQYNLNFTLIPDTQHQLCEQFGVWQEKQVFGKQTMGVVRSTFVVDAQGIIRWVESPVQVEGHVERVLEAVQRLIT